MSPVSHLDPARAIARKIASRTVECDISLDDVPASDGISMGAHRSPRASLSINEAIATDNTWIEISSDHRRRGNRCVINARVRAKYFTVNYQLIDHTSWPRVCPYSPRRIAPTDVPSSYPEKSRPHFGSIVAPLPDERDGVRMREREGGKCQ